MNRSYKIIPVYTGDISGIASALFELGGMVVIHDPSGCNSTYNTHDETRWYDHDSLIFISGLSQTDAIMGDDEKFIREIEEAARQLFPKFIAITSSPIPYMNGTDFPAIARLITRDTGIPAFYVKANGMHDYIKGAGEAFLQIAHNLLPDVKIAPQERSASGYDEIAPQDKRPSGNDEIAPQVPKKIGNSNFSYGQKSPKINLIGVTPLDFCGDGAVEVLRKSCGEQGFSICSCWAMGDTLENLQKAPEADANLVVSAAGFAAAEYMYEKYRIPYVVGIPAGDFADVLFDALRQTIKDGENRIPYRQEQNRGTYIKTGTAEMLNAGDAEDDIENAEDTGNGNPAEIYAIGEPVSLGSLAAAITLRTGKGVKVLCPLEADAKLLGDMVIFTDGEEEAEKALASAKIIIADPLYRPICSPNTEFYAFPHQAFSGRCFRRDFKHIQQMLDEILRPEE